MNQTGILHDDPFHVAGGAAATVVVVAGGGLATVVVAVVVAAVVELGLTTVALRTLPSTSKTMLTRVLVVWVEPIGGG